MGKTTGKQLAISVKLPQVFLTLVQRLALSSNQSHIGFILHAMSKGCNSDFYISKCVYRS